MHMKFIAFEVANHVATVTITRPEVRNALHPEAYFELSQVCDTIEEDDDIWLGVLTGSGEQAFCAGRDLKRLAVTTQNQEEEKKDEVLLSRTKRLTDRFYFSKPMIARLNGSAYGGGLELALACDIIVAAEHARLGLPEPKRGLMATAGGVHRLPRQIPLKIAMGHLLTGRDMSASRAYQLGLVNEVVASDELDTAINEWVADILSCAPLAVRATKECAMRGLDLPLSDATRKSYSWEQRRLRSEDAAEGPRAFAEKRLPVWKGR